jgi:hypothetical protein
MPHVYVHDGEDFMISSEEARTLAVAGMLYQNDHDPELYHLRSNFDWYEFDREICCMRSNRD